MGLNPLQVLTRREKKEKLLDFSLARVPMRVRCVRVRWCVTYPDGTALGAAGLEGADLVLLDELHGGVAPEELDSTRLQNKNKNKY